MKRRLLKMVVALLVPVVWVACKDDKFEDSIFEIIPSVPNAVDEWINANFVGPHNIEVVYRWSDVEADPTYNLIPPQMDTVVPFLKVVKHGWIQPYLDILGKDVMNPVFPKQILLLGSAGYNQNGSKTLGTAEGGKKVILYDLDSWNPQDSAKVWEYFHILHHEFTHILNQKKEYLISFEQITPKDYTSSWGNVQTTTANSLGFVSNYAMAEPGEDYAETLSLYVVNTPEAWETLMSGAGETGRANIQKKLDHVRTYLEESWRIDIDQLRSLVNQAFRDILDGNY